MIVTPLLARDRFGGADSPLRRATVRAVMAVGFAPLFMLVLRKGRRGID